MRKKREVMVVGYVHGRVSQGRARTQAVTQIHTDRHTEHVNRHMGRPCAASLPVVESKPGAKAHASRNAHAATHTHTHARTVFPRGIFPAFAFVSWSAPKEKAGSGAGEVNDTARVTGTALYTSR